MKNKKAVWIVAGIILLPGAPLLPSILAAQSAPVIQHIPVDATWGTETWSDNNKSYIAARKVIDNDFSHDRVTLTYLSDLEASWERNESDPLRVFRWAYAHHRARGLHPPLLLNIFFPDSFFNQAPAPHSYQYTRVRFLSKMDFGRYRELMPVGQRLLKKDPNDFDVEYAYANCFGESLSPEQKIAALAYADQLIQKYPAKPSVYAVKGGVYLSYWIDHRNRQDAVKAIKWYQQYLKLAPANYEWRKHAESTIALLQSHMTSRTVKPV